MSALPQRPAPLLSPARASSHWRLGPALLKTVPPLAFAIKMMNQWVPKKDKLFGMDLEHGPSALRKSLAPKGVEPKIAKMLGEQMIDAVSLPGMLSAEKSDDVLENLEAAMAQLVSDKHQDYLDEEMVQDLKWKQLSRLSLKGVKSPEDLASLVKDVRKIKYKQLKIVVNNQATILSLLPWPNDLIRAWSVEGYISRISRDCVDYYITLLDRLASDAKAHDWEYAEEEIKFFVKDLSLLRNTANCRLSALVSIYTYLRDAFHKSFQLPELEATKMDRLFKEVESLQSGQNPAKSATSQGPSRCPKCQSYIHGGNPCPWAKLQNKQAKAAAKAAYEAAGKLVAGEVEDEK